jgi:penicillin-binding protein 1C
LLRRLHKAGLALSRRSGSLLALWLVGALVLIGVDRHLPPALARSVPQTSIVVEDHRGLTLRAFPVSGGVWRLKAELSRLDPRLVDAVIAYEDQRFWHHGGVDGLAILRALKDSLGAGRIVSGASTIAMQTVRLTEPRPRNFTTKVLDAARAVQLSGRYSKRELLEWYLTLAPYGGNLEGVRAASLAYFGREPVDLTAAEIALLVALPQSPEARRPDLKPQNARRARDRVILRLADAGVFTAEEAVLALDAPVPQRLDFPSLAWHGTAEIAKTAPPHAAQMRATLDGALQAELEALALRAAREEGEAVQVAILVVENKSLAVRAHVGSASLDVPGGWLDLTARLRSPGSTLKPFIYGLAMDDGLATLATVMPDAPFRFSDYAPDNFDRTFRGEVRLADALSYSLNVPAVHALDRIGADRFVAVVERTGVRLAVNRQTDDGRVGLAIALGGLGITAKDLAMLYTGVANEGRVLPLRWTQAAPVQEAGLRLMSEQAARDLLTAMADAPAPAGHAPGALVQGASPIAFKTGTSYGFRDAWAAGISGDYTIIVWVGRADAKPRPGRTGRLAAAPILFDAFAQLRSPETAKAIARPRGLSPSEGLARFKDEDIPHILFPPEEATIIAHPIGAQGFVLAAQGKGPFTWYVDGTLIGSDAARQSVWTPQGEGFFDIRAVDAQGRTNRVTVRVKSAG